MLKFELTSEYIRLVTDIVVYRIRATKDINNTYCYIKKGTLGGYVEHSCCLSQDGTSWVASNAIVTLGARVRDNAYVCDDVMITDKALVDENAYVGGTVRVFEVAKITNNAIISANGFIYGNVIIDKNESILGNIIINK